MIILSIVLFFVLTPGIFIRLPPKSSKYIVAFTHAIVFTAVYHLFCRFFWRAKMGKSERFAEGFTEGANSDSWTPIVDWIEANLKTSATNDDRKTIQKDLHEKLDKSKENLKIDMVKFLKDTDKFKSDAKYDDLKDLIDTYKS